MIRKVLIANRGEIACRIIRSCRKMGISTVAVHSDADCSALFVEMADEAISLGGTTASESYLRGEAILAAARATCADAIHPGYGFLSENPDFAEAVAQAGLIFIGPPAAAIRAMGLKDAAKAAMEKAGVPVVPGYHGAAQDPDLLLAEARSIGFPVLIKARAGGGGKGMRKVEEEAGFRAALESAAREAKASFGDSACLIEKYVSHPRHIEIQVFADGHGNVVHLFERDCSLQRRHQKVIEEAPAPGMPEDMREAMGEAAVRAARAIGYCGAGTVEFIADASDGLRMDRFWFMEMNTRLQVEHPVTEAITGVDLVEWQVRVASGEKLPKTQEALAIDGWAFEARLYAEDAERGFLPAIGRIEHLDLPEDCARIDSGVRGGDEITPFYDPMIAKIIVHGETRAEALGRLTAALSKVRVAGTTTNAGFLTRLSRQEDFVAGNPDTGLIARHLDDLAKPEPLAPEMAVLAAIELSGLLQPVRAQGPVDPWSACDGFRLWSPARLHVTLAHRGEPLAIVLQPGLQGQAEARVAGAPLHLGWRRLADGTVALTRDGRTVPVTVIRHGRAVTLHGDGASYSFEIVDPLQRADACETGGNRLVAPMPGLIKRVLAAAGQAVSSGEAVVVMEAMKMELTLSAPRDGIIAAIGVAEGEQVREGAVLAELLAVEGGDG